MESMRKVSLDQMLATIPPQSQRTLDEKIDDIHLVVIARALINWKSACITLGISKAEEEAIVEENKTADTRRVAVLRKWRSKYGPTATHRNLAKCFYDADKLEVVEATCRALGTPDGSAEGQQQASHQESSVAAFFKHENQAAIKAKFADFQTKVCERLVKNGVNIELIRLFVENQFPPGDCIPPPPAGLIEIFRAITHHGLWDYFHYSPLVKIVQRFGAQDLELETYVETYKKDIKSFRLVTKVEDVIDADVDFADIPPAKKAKYTTDVDEAHFPQEERAKNNLHYCCPVEWKTEFIDHSLQYLAEVWEEFSCHYLGPKSPPTALLNHVRKGCFSITWLVPSYLIPALSKRAKTDTDFFQHHHFVRVTVGEECVYEDISEESTTIADVPALDDQDNPLKITRHPENTSVATGAPSVFTVEATGDNLQFQWQKNGKDIDQDDSRHHCSHTDDISTLCIECVEKSDKGHYKCLVKNPVQKRVLTTHDAQLSVFNPPEITRHPESTSVATGAPAVFTVEATGDNLQFQWQKNGKDIDQDKSRLHCSHTDNISTLRIERVEKSDKGHYTCFINNLVEKSGITSHEAELNVCHNWRKTANTIFPLLLVLLGTVIGMQWLLVIESQPYPPDPVGLPFNLHDIPTLHSLRHFPVKRKHIDIAEEIGPDYEKFGTLLLEDKKGNKVMQIKVSEHGDPVDITVEILKQWLQGKGRKPVTWQILIKCLRDTGFHFFADEIESSFLEHDGSKNSNKAPSEEL